MRPWTIDADDIQVAEDFDATLMHRTNWIDDFLAHGRDEKFIVTGTKGFGKTLLLKAKRVAYQQSKSTMCLPENSLLDKPIGDKVFSAEMIELFGHTTDNWRKVWLISIAAATLKHLGLADDLPVSPKLASLLADRNLRSVIDHFVNVLDFPRGELFRSGADTDSHLVPRLRGVNTPVAMFIDSIDEYFNKHIVTASRRASDAGELSADVWHLSQMALVETAYQLRRVNHHVKIFASIRKEAFDKLDDTTPMVQQYRGSTINISYSAAGLREIFLNNIRKEKERNLVRPGKSKSDPIEAFFGFNEVTHAATGLQEDVFEYVYRHTLQRPRDLMTIGQKLADIAPPERTERAVKVAVNQGATEIAREYLKEISPYIGLELDSVFALIRGNVLTRDEIDRIFREHNGALRAQGNLEGGDAHVFCMLFKAGLLGHVVTDLVSAERVQRFARPGERTFDPDGILPQSTHYLVHPVLAELILRANSKYAEHLDHANVVGDGRPWHESGGEEPLCVLRADIKDFSEFMARGAVEQDVRKRLSAAVQAHAADTCRHHEISSGDSITLVHHDPNAIVKVIRRIMEDLFEADGNPVLRVAIDHGRVTMSAAVEAGIMSGLPLRMAARLEPHVTANEIWVTESFKNALEAGPSRYSAVEIPAEEQPAENWSAGLLNIKKLGSREPDEWIRVYRLEDKSVR